MNKKVLKYIVFLFLVVLIGTVYYFVSSKKLPKDGSIETPISQSEIPKYNNIEYGFSFSLPSSWIGYSIIVQNWEGNMIDSKVSSKVIGPEVIIRHPLWTSVNQRQDIPIMIFTPSEWSLIEQEKLSLGAAPIGPSELGRNSNYIFALPARYNYAYPVGFEEVEKIIQSKPLSAF